MVILMGIKRTPGYFDSFRCAGGGCGDNCCIGWEIDIDDETFELYKNTEGEFGNRLRASMAENDENSFVLANNRCPFLNDDNLCDIFINMGEENLCTVCTEYPRFTEKFGALTEMGLGMSCATAAELILKNPGKDKFVTSFDEKAGSEIDENLFGKLLFIRERIFEILQNRRRTIKERAACMLFYAEAVQKCINENRNDDIENIQYDFAVEKTYDEDDLRECMKLCLDLEIMEDGWTAAVDGTMKLYNGDYEKISAKFSEYTLDREYEYEHMLVYFIFRYLLKAVFDFDVLTKVKFAVSSYIIIHQFDLARYIANGGEFSFEDRVKNCVLYSKEVEHCEDNIEFFAEEFLFNEIFEIKRFAAMI